MELFKLYIAHFCVWHLCIMGTIFFAIIAGREVAVTPFEVFKKATTLAIAPSLLTFGIHWGLR